MNLASTFLSLSTYVKLSVLFLGLCTIAAPLSAREPGSSRSSKEETESFGSIYVDYNINSSQLAPLVASAVGEMLRSKGFQLVPKSKTNDVDFVLFVSGLQQNESLSLSFTLARKIDSSEIQGALRAGGNTPAALWVKNQALYGVPITKLYLGTVSPAEINKICKDAITALSENITQ